MVSQQSHLEYDFLILFVLLERCSTVPLSALHVFRFISVSQWAGICVASGRFFRLVFFHSRFSIWPPRRGMIGNLVMICDTEWILNLTAIWFHNISISSECLFVSARYRVNWTLDVVVLPLAPPHDSRRSRNQGNLFAFRCQILTMARTWECRTY